MEIKKKLTQLTASELQLQLKMAKLSISTAKFDEKEALLRLTKHLIDQGEDPTSYEFTTIANNQEQQKNEPSFNLTAKRSLVNKIVKLERYFTLDGRGRGL